MWSSVQQAANEPANESTRTPEDLAVALGPALAQALAALAAPGHACCLLVV